MTEYRELPWLGRQKLFIEPSTEVTQDQMGFVPIHQVQARRSLDIWGDEDTELLGLLVARANDFIVAMDREPTAVLLPMDRLVGLTHVRDWPVRRIEPGGKASLVFEVEGW